MADPKEALKKKVADLKDQVAKAKAAGKDSKKDPAFRTLRKQLKRAQRRLALLSPLNHEEKVNRVAKLTDLLAKRNEALESIARRDAATAFEAVATDPKNIDRAKVQAEKQLRGLGKAWGAHDVVITWSAGAAKPATML